MKVWKKTNLTFTKNMSTLSLLPPTTVTEEDVTFKLSNTVIICVYY